MSHLRPATAADLEAVLELRRDCYPGQALSDEALRHRYLHNARFDLSDLWLDERAGQLAAMAVSMNLQCYVPGGVQKLAGLASVAVSPSHRRGGVGAQLVCQLLRQAHESGQALAGLYAFEYAYYRRFGYAPAVLAQLWQVAPANLPSDPEGLRLQPLRSPSSLYHQAETAAGRLALVRNQAFWDSLMQPQERRGYGCEQGYLIYQHRRNPHQPLTTQVEVLEISATTPAGWRAVIGHLHLLQEQVTQVTLPMPSDSSFPLLWKEPRQLWAQEVRGEDYTLGQQSVGMALRWVNPVLALTGRSYPGVGEAQFTIGVHDPVGVSQGRFRLQFEHGQLSVQPTDAEPELQAEVGAWTQWWCGAVDVQQMLAWGGLQGDLKAAYALAERFRPACRPFVHGLDAY